MDAACTIQDSIHVFSLVHKYVSRILGTYHTGNSNVWGCFLSTSHPNLYFQWNFFPAWSIIERTTGRKETGGNLDAEKRKK